MRSLSLSLLVALLLVGLTGCGSGGFDAVSGNASLVNGTVNGAVSVQTPLGTFTYPGPGPSPQSPSPSPSP